MHEMSGDSVGYPSQVLRETLTETGAMRTTAFPIFPWLSVLEVLLVARSLSVGLLTTGQSLLAAPPNGD